MRLTDIQKDIIEWLRNHPRYELRRGSDGMAYIYDLELVCHFDWVVWRTTVVALERKGLIEAFSTDPITGATRFRLTTIAAHPPTLKN